MKYLCYFEGGPLDGKVFSTHQMFGFPEPMPLVEEYEWTSSRVKGKEGKNAQVWRWKSYTYEETGTEIDKDE